MEKKTMTFTEEETRFIRSCMFYRYGEFEEWVAEYITNNESEEDFKKDKEIAISVAKKLDPDSIPSIEAIEWIE